MLLFQYDGQPQMGGYGMYYRLCWRQESDVWWILSNEHLRSRYLIFELKLEFEYSTDFDIYSYRHRRRSDRIQDSHGYVNSNSQHMSITNGDFDKEDV